jgi:subtilisin family serine protease
VIGESGARYTGLAEWNGVVRIKTTAERLVAIEAMPRGEFPGLYRRLPAAQGRVASLGSQEVRLDPQVERFDWGAVTIGADTVSDRFTGRGVRVAIVDTGIEIGHPDLAVTHGVNFVDDEPVSAWGDDYGHGTFVAGIVGGLANSVGIRGVSPGVELFAVRVGKFDASQGMYVNEALGTDLIEALRWCLDHRMDIVNISMELSPSDEDLEALENVLSEAYHDGVLLIAPSGNDGHASVSYPAASQYVLGVGALGDSRIVQGLTFFERDRGGASHFATNSSEFVPWFSNFGRGLDLLAPGSAVASTLPIAAGSYARLSGTSMAAPFVSGTCALLLEATGGLSRTAARITLIAQALRDGARRLEGVLDTVQGRGVVDVPRSLALLGL